MSMFLFEVGKKGVHTVSFEISRIMGNYSLKVDGNPIQKGMHIFMGSKEAVFEVGNREKHKIRINWQIPPFGGFRTWEANVFIDDKPYNTYKL